MAKLFKRGSVSRVANAKRSSGRSKGVSVPFQPSKGGATVIKPKGSPSKSRKRSFKLDIKTK
jgi:hypothetical protein